MDDPNRVLIYPRDHEVIRGNVKEHFAYPLVRWRKLKNLDVFECVLLCLRHVFLLEAVGYCTLLQTCYSRIQYPLYHGFINIVKPKG